ncbi:MAG TPA: sigma 54-interacting transcriptional regulator, partial [Candidatus Polarisedimenticolia bacterium]|nr:sigma 54-interacting transcriptional regulator [Candidatus Polarisedimenticolia bacterium]
AAIQAKLLRVIESREFERLGGKETVRVDIRLVTATNSDIMREVDEGRFRQDLFYRLNVVAIRLPPLRDRREDIPLLADHFLDRFCRENARPRKRLAADALKAVTAHEWKGNVRELEHAMESLVLLTDRDLITAGDLPLAIRSGVPAAPDTRPDVQAGPAPGASDPEPLPEAGIVLERQVAAFERNLLLSALHKAEGRRKEAAALLGLNKDQMKYLCRKYGL